MPEAMGGAGGMGDRELVFNEYNFNFARESSKAWLHNNANVLNTNKLYI